MALDPITAAFDAGKMLIERLWPDPAKQAEELRKLEELKQNGDLRKLELHVDLLRGQLQINLKEAEHKSVFVAGARPFIIWVGGFSLAWSGLVHPLLTWVWAFAGMDGNPPPMLDSGAITGIVTGLLGIGGMRSFDKAKGVETNSIR